MEKFDKKWLRDNRIDVSDKNVSDDGKFFLKDGHSITVVDKKAERQLLEILRDLTARPAHNNVEVCRNASIDQRNRGLSVGSPMLIENKHFNMGDLNSALDACIASYMGD